MKDLKVLRLSSCTLQDCLTLVLQVYCKTLVLQLSYTSYFGDDLP